MIAGNDGAKETNTVYESENGIDWKVLTASAAFKPRSGHASYVYKDRMWIIGGKGNSGEYYNDVLWSVDGHRWTAASEKIPFAGRMNHAAEVHVDRVWITGGENEKLLDDIWVGK